MKSLKKIIVEGAFFSTVSSFGMRGLSLINYFVIFRYVMLAEYGRFILVSSLTGPALTLCFLGIDRIFVSAIARARGAGEIGKARGLIKQYAAAVFFMLCMTAGGAVFLKDVLQARYGVEWDRTIFSLLIFLFSQLIFNLVQLILEGFEEFNKLALLQFIEAMVRSAFLIAFAQALGLYTLLLIGAAAKLAAFLLGAFFLARCVYPVLRGSVSARGMLWSVIASQGKWDMARNIVDDVAGSIGVWLIKIFVSTPAVALYSFAQNVYSIIADIFPVNSILFPIVSRLVATEKKKVYRLIPKIQRYALLFYVVIYALTLVFLPFVVNAFFPQYRGVVPIVALSLLRLFIDVYRIGQSALIYAFGEQRFMLAIFPYMFVTHILLDTVSAYLGGVPGMLASWNFRGVIGQWIIHFHLKKKHHIPSMHLRDLFMIDEYDRVFWRLIALRVKQLYTGLRL
ncbi:MAG: oligosaccharide flippase family protein [Patescibacteria group bacterium]|mgnify:CR=1 FL=1